MLFFFICREYGPWYIWNYFNIMSCQKIVLIFDLFLTQVSLQRVEYLPSYDNWKTTGNIIDTQFLCRPWLGFQCFSCPSSGPFFYLSLSVSYILCFLVLSSVSQQLFKIFSSNFKLIFILGGGGIHCVIIV